MKKIMKLLIVIAFVLMQNQLLIAQNTEGVKSYEKEIKEWHQKRLESLRSENGWLNLAGLYWLEEGENTFGSDKSNKVIFPKGEPFLGHFVLKNGEVYVEIKANTHVFNSKNQVVKSLKLFPMDDDIVLKHESLRWFIIKRGDKYGIRLRDLESPTLLHFVGIETYPVASNWRIKTRLESVDSNKTIPITDVLGHTNMQRSPGTAVFMVEGKEYRLDAVESGKQLFFIFKDATSGKETYGAGRFLYTERPEPNSDGVIYLDFNKATNPPCAFTEFATCPLAPKQNWLPIPITAGEKNYGEH